MILTSNERYKQEQDKGNDFKHGCDLEKEDEKKSGVRREEGELFSRKAWLWLIGQKSVTSTVLPGHSVIHANPTVWK